jgi:hypothetical protein
MTKHGKVKRGYCYTKTPEGYTHIRATRSGPYKVLSNPYELNEEKSNRDEVCDQFYTYYHSDDFDAAGQAARGMLLQRLIDGENLEINCYCAIRKRCHTDTIVADLQQRLDSIA